jgi:hypothetical protein
MHSSKCRAEADCFYNSGPDAADRTLNGAGIAALIQPLRSSSAAEAEPPINDAI